MKKMSTVYTLTRLCWSGVILATILGITSCGPSSTDSREMVDQEESYIPLDKVAVCMYPLVYVKEEPDYSLKQFTDISYYEEVEMLSERAEKGSRSYMKVRLSDRQEGWVLEYPFEKHARLAVLLDETETFRRPQAMTIMDSKFEAGEIIAVILGEDSVHWVDGWYKVSGAKKNRKGWIRRGAHVSFSPRDIKAAFHIFTALQKETLKDQRERLEELAEDPLVAQSPFEDLRTFHIARLDEELGDKATAKLNLRQGEKVIILESQVPVLKDPSGQEQQNNIVKELKRNDEVTVLEVAEANTEEQNATGKYWVKIEHEGTEGWVDGDYMNRRPQIE